MSNKRIIYANDEKFDLKPITVHPINMNQFKKNNDMSQNFLEFRRIYGPLFDSRFLKKPYLRYEQKPAPNRRRIDVKTIRMEMPIMGTEQAVIKPNKIPPKKQIPVHPTPIAPKTIKKVEVKSQAPNSSRHEPIKKLSNMESLSRDSKISIHHSTSTFVDLTNRELEITNQQLCKIKKIMEQKQVETQTPMKVSKLKKKNRHSDCDKKYLSNLSSMRKKLKALEEKFYNRPQVVYRSVNERCTQASLNTVYHDKTFYPHAKFDETLNEAVTDLQDIPGVKIMDEFPVSGSKNIAFGKIMHKAKHRPFEHDGSMSGLDTNDFQDIAGVKIMDEFPTSGSKNIAFGKIMDKAKPRLFEDDESMSGLDIESLQLSRILENFTAPKSPNELDYKPGGDFEEKYKKNESNFLQKPSKNVRFDFDEKKNEFSGDFIDDTETKKYNWLDSRTNYIVNKKSVDVANKTNLKSSFKVTRDDFEYKNGEDVSKCIDSSETTLKKYRSIKQDIMNMNAFCDKICNLTQSDEEDEDEIKHKKELAELQTLMLNECPALIDEESKREDDDGTKKKNLFDETKLQSSVMKSSYLMKEFNIKPKIFTEIENGVSNKNKSYEISNKFKESDNGGVQNLLDNLEFALENSVYFVGDFSKCNSSVK